MAEENFERRQKVSGHMNASILPLILSATSLVKTLNL